MSLLLRILLVFALLITGLHAQTKTVLKNINGNTITESLTIGSGKTLTIASGASIVAASGSTITGFGGGSGSGSVTSVALSLPSIFTVTGSPITESGTLTGTLATQTANRLFAGPTTGSAAAPTFRALVAADIPDLTATYQPLSSTLTTLSTGFGSFAIGSRLVKWNTSTLTYNLAGLVSPDEIGIISAGSVLAADTAGAASNGTSKTVTQILDWLGSTQGQILHRNASTWVPLSPDTAGQVLTTGGTGANPSWADLNASSITTGTLDIARIADASITNVKLATNPLARANHTGTQLLATISDAGTLAGLSAITSTQLTDGTIVNADINASAAIAGTKVDAGTTTTRGTVELATDGETAANVAVQGNDARLANANRVEIGLAASDEASDNTASTTIAKVTFRMPYAMTLTGVRCSLTKAATGALFIVDIHESGTSIMTTNKLSVDASETTSLTAATAAVITDSSLANDAVIEIFIDQVGTTTDNTGEGVKVWLIGNR